MGISGVMVTFPASEHEECNKKSKYLSFTDSENKKNVLIYLLIFSHNHFFIKKE